MCGPKQRSVALEGFGLGKEDPRAEEFAYGRNVAVLSVCWDEWKAGPKEKVSVMARTR